MVTIIVDRDITLRTYKKDDAAELFEKVDGSRRHLSAWLSWVNATTKPEHSVLFIEESLSKLESQEMLAVGIFYHNELIGGVGMHQWEHDIKKAQVGYWVVKQYEGRGIVTKSLKLFLNFLFEKLKLNKLEIRYIPANIRSAQVAQRLGFKTEGILRQSYLNNGVIEDLVITGLLVTEWRNFRDL